MRLAVRPCEIVFQVIFGAVRLCQLSPNVEMGEGCGIRSLCFELSMRKESEGVECWRFDLPRLRFWYYKPGYVHH